MAERQLDASRGSSSHILEIYKEAVALSVVGAFFFVLALVAISQGYPWGWRTWLWRVPAILVLLALTGRWWSRAADRQEEATKCYFTLLQEESKTASS